MLDKAVNEIRLLQRAAVGKEICGILDSEYEVHPITNVSNSPEDCFIFSKKEYFSTLKKLLALNRTILAIYHTHPEGICYPSEADMYYINTSKRNGLIVTDTQYRWLECQ